MANLIAYLSSNTLKNRKSATGSQYVVARAENWTNHIEVELDKNGEYTVRIGQKGAGTGREIASGNLDKAMSLTDSRQS